MNSIKFLSGLVLVSIFILGCDNKAVWEAHEQAMIQDYIKKLGDTAYVIKPSGLYYIELQEGTGRSPVAGDTVAIWFKGMLLTRYTFESNMNGAVPYKAKVGANQLVPGVDEGVRYMKEGGIARLLTPSNLAYGPVGYSTIPGYTPLVWEIHLESVTGPIK
jgi:FKBP-type peptidyl-prolyl cis-trans isomerase